MIDQFYKSMVPERFDQSISQIQLVEVRAIGKFSKVKSGKTRHSAEISKTLVRLLECVQYFALKMPQVNEE